MSIKFKNMKSLELLDTEIKVKNEVSKNIIYTHSTTNSTQICFTTNVEVFAEIKIDIKMDLPEELLETNDFHKLENLIYRTTQLYSDFNEESDELEKLELEAIDQNIQLNSKIIKTAFLEMIVLVVLALLQFGVLRYYVKMRK